MALSALAARAAGETGCGRRRLIAIKLAIGPVAALAEEKPAEGAAAAKLLVLVVVVERGREAAAAAAAISHVSELYDSFTVPL